MKPLSKYTSRCPDALPSKCISWNGPNIPCLDICYDDVLTDVVHAIGVKVCEIAGDLDLSTLDLGCLIDLCDTCPDTKSVKVIFQLLLDNQCKLKTLIDDIVTAINSGGSGGGSGVVLDLNYKCIEVLDAFGNPVPQDLNQTLQSIINELCDHKTLLANHESRITTIESNYCHAPCGEGGGSGGYEEPIITLCTSTVPKILSQSVIDLGNDYCDYKPIIGTEAEALAAISKQPNLTTDPNYAAWLASGLIIGTDYTSVSDSEYNQWILIKSLLDRVNTIETTCCAPSCEDIHIGFDASYDEENAEFNLEFSYAAGTEIPVGVVDCGSVMTLTDSAGKTKVLPITIENGLVFTISNLTGLSTKDPISVTIKTCFNFPNGLNCKDCVGGTLPSVQPCGFCKLCAVGGTNSDILSISYTKNGVAAASSLKPGDCIYFENADVVIITSVNTTSDSISLVSDQDNPCDSIIIPEPTPAICWFFKIPVTLTLNAIKGSSNYDFQENFREVFTYNKLYCVAEPGGIDLTGSVLFNGGIATGGSTDDFMTIRANTPTVTSPNIIGNNYCHSTFDIRWDTGNGGPTITGEGDTAPLIYQYQPHTTLDDGTITDDATQFGILLKILGQPETIAPTIELNDPVNNVLLTIKGVANDDCTCSSV